MQKQFMGVAALGAALAVADGSHAQAVRWRVEDGGNGHWYALRVYANLSLLPARADALREGGDLVSIASEAENAFIATFVPFAPPVGGHPTFLIGAVRHNQTSCNSDGSAFRWLDGTPFTYTNWCSNGNPNCWGEQLVQIPANPGFDDCWGDVGYLSDSAGIRAVMIEWSADCNNDGIVDYGQCRDGSLPDYNGNNIPDCCERSEACVIGNYPVQWRTQDGGNGHWYSLTSQAGTWDEAQRWAHAIGGNLASVTSSTEHGVVRSIGESSWIGARKLPGQPWAWIDGTQWSFTSWCPGEPCCFDNGLYVFMSTAGCWDDHNQTETMRKGVVEYSADCNNDGLVDYGQILQGQLADLNANGIPDVCEQPTCATADLFRDFNVNGADLGIMLSQWGETTSFTVSDLNHDGSVDGIDLGLLLAFWGPCPG